MKPLSLEAARLLKHLERKVIRKVNAKVPPDTRQGMLSHSWTNTKLARDAGINVDFLQRARQELTDKGFIFPVLPMPYSRGKKSKASARGKIARHTYTLKFQTLTKDSRQR